MSGLTLKPKLINWYKANKLSIITMLVVLFFLILLDNDRFTTSEASKQKDLSINNAESLTMPRLSNESFALIESRYENFDQNEESKQANKTQLMSAAEQEKQQGELVSIFIGDNQLKLRAVVSYNIQPENKAVEHAYYALIEITDLIKGERVIQKYQHKDDVFGYQLIIKPNQQVQLVAQSGAAKRIINLVMYQKSKKTLEKTNEQALFNQNNIKKSSE